MAYSYLIKNGTVVDGTGGKPYRADVGISGSYIKDIGDLGNASADKVIDASNFYVTPGFIDLTSHSDTYWTLFAAPGQDSLLTQGITTILVGNCGESLAPIVKKESFKALERWATTPGINADWNSVEEYLDALSRLGTGVNVATLVGQETLRRGARSKEEMTLLLQKALDDGAWGMSSNFSFVEWSRDLDEETRTLLDTVREAGGLYKVHLRDEGKDFLPAVASVLNLLRRSPARTVISHFKGIGKSAWRSFGRALTMIKNSREDGIPISVDTFPYLRTGSMLATLLPQWARSGTSEEILERLTKEETANTVKEMLKSFTLHGERILIAGAMKDKTIVGKTLDEVAKSANISLEEAIVEILKINRLNVTIFGKTVHQKHLLETLKFQGAIVATDGAGYDLGSQRSGDLVHPRSFGAYPRFLGKIASEAGIPMETAIKQSTSLPAAQLGLKDRGTLKEGLKADIAVFHPEELKDNSTYKNPYRYSSGVKYVFVNGKPAIENGGVSNEKLGEVLRKK